MEQLEASEADIEVGRVRGIDKLVKEITR